MIVEPGFGVALLASVAVAFRPDVGRRRRRLPGANPLTVRTNCSYFRLAERIVRDEMFAKLALPTRKCATRLAFYGADRAGDTNLEFWSPGTTIALNRHTTGGLDELNFDLVNLVFPSTA